MCSLRSCLVASMLMLHVFFDQFGTPRSKAINGFAGPYVAFGHTMDPCPTNGLVVPHLRLSHFFPSRPTELQKISGNITSRVNVYDKYLTQVHMAVWANNQWKDNAFIFKFPNKGCTALRDQLPNFFRLLAKNHNDSSRMPVDKKTTCVIPAGRVVLVDEPIDWVFPNVPVMPYGRYKFTISMVDTKAGTLPFMCLTVACEVIPKTY